LDQPEAFKQALRQIVEMNAGEHRDWCEGAQQHGIQFSQSEEIVEQNRDLFRQAVSRS
jgi:hypothetical protein